MRWQVLGIKTSLSVGRLADNFNLSKHDHHLELIEEVIMKFNNISSVMECKNNIFSWIISSNFNLCFESITVPLKYQLGDFINCHINRFVKLTRPQKNINCCDAFNSWSSLHPMSCQPPWHCIHRTKTTSLIHLFVGQVHECENNTHFTRWKIIKTSCWSSRGWGPWRALPTCSQSTSASGPSRHGVFERRLGWVFSCVWFLCSI